jgi:hypothetical protein
MALARNRRCALGVAATLALLALAGCAAGDARFTDEGPAGFWVGLWHGIIAFITLVIGIFDDGVRVYEIHNSGGWYDFGFLIGATAIWGHRTITCARRGRMRADKEWQEIGQKVERKLARLIREWAEAEPDADWRVVGEKAERKLKQRVREWAEEP